MKRIKKSLAFVLSLAILLLFASCGAQGGSSKPATSSGTGTSGTGANTIKIGLIFPLSGANADQGVFNVDGAKLAVEKINAAGGIASLDGAKLELVIYDNESNADTSKTVAERMIAENPDLVAVHGASASAYVLPILSTFEKAEIPFLTAQTSQTITSQGYQYAFAFASQSPQFAAGQVAMLEWLNETYDLNIKKVGIVYEDSEWGLTNSAAARDSIKASKGLELVYDQSYQASASDLSSLVVGMMDAGCEVVFPTSYTQDAKLIFNTMVSYDYQPLIIGGGAGFLYPVFAEDLGDLVDGVLSIASHNYDAASVKETSFPDVGKEFEEKYGYMMPEQGVSAFNAIYIISQALEAAGSTETAAVRDAIRALDISTLTPGGPLTFDETGWNTASEAVMVQWQKDDDGVYRPHTVFPENEATVDFQLPPLLANR